MEFDGLGVSATLFHGWEEGRGRKDAVSRGCLVYRHWEVVDHERAAVEGLSYGRLSACNGELMDAGFRFTTKNALCTETATIMRIMISCGFDMRFFGLSQGSVTDFEGVSVNIRISAVWEK